MLIAMIEGRDQQDYNYYSEDYYDEAEVNITEQNVVDSLNLDILENMDPLEAITANMDNLPLFSDDDYDMEDYHSSNYAKPNIRGDTSFSTMRDVSKVQSSNH